MKAGSKTKNCTDQIHHFWFLSAIIILFFCNRILSLPAQDQNEGFAYFDAGDYTQSISVYKGMLDRGLEPWQKEMINYNMATGRLANGEWEEAIIAYEVLFDENIKLPLLKQRILNNLALAKLMQLENRIAALNESVNKTYADFNKIYIFFYKVLQEIDRADLAWCALEATEGADHCRPSVYLELMRLKTKSDLGKFLADFQKFRLSRGSGKQGDLLLLLEEKSPLDILKTSSNLNVLQQLSELYDTALFSDPIEASFLSKILKAQVAFEKPFEETTEAFLMEYYAKSLKYLKLSLESLGTSHPIDARLYIQIAHFYLSYLVEQLNVSLKTSPIAVLENVIAKEEFVLLLNQSREQIQENASFEIDHLLPDLQQLVMTEARQFLDAVLAGQKQVFSAFSQAKTHCQCHPWNEVIPLFGEGYMNAGFSDTLLKAGDLKIGSNQRLQKKAIDYWKEALAKLRNPSSSQSPKSSPEKQEPNQHSDKQESGQQSEQQDLSPKNETGSAKLNEILRMVQEMEKDDQSKPQQVKTNSDKGEERPW